MSIFGNLKSEGLEETQDRLGGVNVRDTDIYPVTIKAAYAGKSDGGATSVSLILNLPDGTEYNETNYVTNKKGENFFLNKNDNSKKVPLPGFTIIDDICLVCTGKPLSEQDTEEKVLKIYDYNEKKEMPKTVPVLSELTGQTFFAGIVQQTVDKTKKNDSTGDYEPTGETRQENIIEKVFHDPSKLTVVEARNNQSEPDFYTKWQEKNKGVTRNRSKANKDSASGSAPQSGRPGGNAAAKPTASLFGKK